MKKELPKDFENYMQNALFGSTSLASMRKSQLYDGKRLFRICTLVVKSQIYAPVRDVALANAEVPSILDGGSCSLGNAYIHHRTPADAAAAAAALG